MISYYDADKKLIWVEKKYLEESVRPQRKTKFEMNLNQSIAPTTINNVLDNVFVNGLPNQAISDKIVPNRKENHSQLGLVEVPTATYKYIGLKVNSYLGNSL